MILPDLWSDAERAISDALDDFTKRHRLFPDDVSPWYHDLAIWIVRQTAPLSNTERLVRSVQITAYRERQLVPPLLFLLPDAYVYDQSSNASPPETSKRLVDEAWVQKNQRTIELVQQGVRRSYDELKKDLDQKLDDTWSSVLRVT